MGEVAICAFDVSDISGNFNGDSLARQRLRYVPHRRLAIAIKPDQGLDVCQSIERLRAPALSFEAIFHARVGESPRHPQTIRAIRVQRTRSFGPVEIRPVAVGNDP